MRRRRSAETTDRSSAAVLLDAAATKMLRFVARAITGLLVGAVCFIGLYYAASSPPLHLFYEGAPAAGPSSVYLPGGGFSGFWFHLGYLHSMADRHDLHDYDYYCYSSGCISILSVFLNRSLEEVYDAASASQNSWMSGNQSRFDIVDYFFEELVPPDDAGFGFAGGHTGSDIPPDDDHGDEEGWVDSCPWNSDSSESCQRKDFLPRIKILVTTLSDGYRVVESRNRKELKENIMKTTWVPFLTGWGVMPTTETDENNHKMVYLDGGFSRVLHPECETELSLPLVWETLVHTFSPGLSRDQVQTLWERGKDYDYPLHISPNKTARVTPSMNSSSRSRGVNSTTTPPSGLIVENEFVGGDGRVIPLS